MKSSPTFSLLVLFCLSLISTSITASEPDNYMYILKDGNGICYYTHNNDFFVNQAGHMVSPNGFFVQGFGIDQNFNLNECPLINLQVPLGELAAAQSTSKINFVGQLSATGSSAVTPFQITPNIRAVHNSQILNYQGTDITGTTLLADVEDQAGPLFDIGNIIHMKHAAKNDRLLPEAEFLVAPNSTVNDLLSWMQSSLGISTSWELSDLDKDTLQDSIPQPGVRLATDTTAIGAQTYIQIVSNMGQANQLDFNSSEAFTISQGYAANKFTYNPLCFAQPDGFELADIDSLQTSVTIYDSLGTPIELNLYLAMLAKTNFSVFWQYFAEYADSSATNRAIATGTIEFDVFGNYVDSDDHYISINRNNSGAENELTVKLDFNHILGYSLYPSTITWAFQNGSQTGTLQDYSIANDGIITGHFTNGLNRTLGKIEQTNISNIANLIPYNQDTYLAIDNPEAPVITSSKKIKNNPDIPLSGMYILKDLHDQLYYTTNDNFTLDFANNLINPNGLVVQGHTIDSNFNIIENSLANLHIPINDLTTQNATTIATFSGDLNASGLPALHPDLSGRLEIHSNIRDIVNSQILNADGANITNNTLLTDVHDSNSPLFAVGNYLYFTNPNIIHTTPPAGSFTIEASSTVDDLLTWLQKSLKISTDPSLSDLDGDGLTDTTDRLGNPVKLPGVRIAVDTTTPGPQSYIEIVYNIGKHNQLTSNDPIYLIISPGTAHTQYVSFPFIFAQPDGFEPADIESIQTSFTAYNSLGSPFNINLTLAMLKKDDYGITWQFFADSSSIENTPYTGIIKFDTNGIFETSYPEYITINHSQPNVTSPQTIILNFSDMDGYSILASSLTLLSQDGFYPGTLSNYSIGSNGIITGQFSNGMTHPLGQLILASFSDYDTMAKLSDDIYTAGPNSGIPFFHKPLDIIPGIYRDTTASLLANNNSMFTLKDSNDNYYYTTNGNFNLNYANNLTTDNGLIVQGHPIDSDFNIRYDTMSNLEIPLGQLTTSRETTKASFSGILNSTGNPAVTLSGSTPNIRGIQDSQILSDFSGYDISIDTHLTNVYDNRGPLFRSGDIIRMSSAYKGGSPLPQHYLHITPNHKISDLLFWMEYILQIEYNSDLADLDNDSIIDTVDSLGNTIKIPGVRLAIDHTLPIAQTYIEIVSNMGPANMLDFKAFEIVNSYDSNNTIRHPFNFTEPDCFKLADIESTRTSFRAYDSSGEKVDIDIILTMVEKNNNGITWQYQTHSQAAKYFHYQNYGTISFDTRGNHIATQTTSNNSPIDIDFSRLKCQASCGYSIILLTSQNGLQSGTLSDYSIGNDGIITGIFTNDQSIPLGQIPLTTFANFDELQVVDQDTYIATSQSGPPQTSAIDLHSALYQYDPCPCWLCNLNQSGTIDLADFSILAQNWLTSETNSIADLDNNSGVTITDLQKFVNCWLTQN